MILKKTSIKRGCCQNIRLLFDNRTPVRYIFLCNWLVFLYKRLYNIIMKNLLDKISSYNLFNYLLPGIIFSVLAGKLTHRSFIQEDIVVGAFVYYFIGLVISRFGSLIIEPILRRVSFLKFAGYKDFVAASREDEKLEILSEANNTYRTLSALFVILLLLILLEPIENIYPTIKNWNTIILVILLLIMFLFSYRKQTEYITMRVAAHKEKK